MPMKVKILMLLGCLFTVMAIDSNGQFNQGPSGLLEDAIAAGNLRFTLATHSGNSSYSTYPLQDSLRTVLVKTIDGNEFVGELLEENAEFIRLRTKTYGEVTLQRSGIKSIKDIEKSRIIGGVIWKDHMQSTRYFWQPSGYGLKKGEAYYQNVWVLFNQFSVGLSDHLILGGGVVPLFLFAGAPTPVWLTPKLSIPIVKDKVNLGLGGLFATVVGEDDLNLGIMYSSATFGRRDRNFTFGVGYGYAGGELASRPIFSANFLSRVGSRGYFIMENYIIDIDRQYGVLSLIGGRSIIGNDAGLDYGLVFPFFPDLGTFFALPWLGITVPLGPKN